MIYKQSKRKRNKDNKEYLKENQEADGKITFEANIDFIKTCITRRKSNWRLSTLDWEDVESILLTRIFQKFDLYDPQKAPLENWLNVTISNHMRNLLRDNLTKFSKPCILGCVYHKGGNVCSWTKSKVHCAECPLYAKWQKKKESEYNIKATLTYDNHAQEINNKQSDFIDIDRAKSVIDEKIKLKLDDRERIIYKMLFVDYLRPKEISEILEGEKEQYQIVESYTKILEIQKKIINLSKEIIREEGLAD